MIATTIFRAYPANEWRTVPAEPLAATTVQPAALRPMDRKTLFGAVVQAGGAVSDLRQLYGYAAYMDDVETALREGDLVAAHGLVALCPVDLGPATQAAIAAVLAANTLRAIDVVAAEQRSTAPAQVTTEDVTAALGEAGYTWDGTHWVV